MWGWKAVERQITDGVSLQRAREIAEAEGFAETVVNPGHVIFKREGSQMATSAEKLPLEMAIARAEQGLFVQLRYDVFVLFDTGDLNRVADELCAKMVG